MVNGNKHECVFTRFHSPACVISTFVSVMKVGLLTDYTCFHKTWDCVPVCGLQLQTRRITVGQGGQTHTQRMWIRRLCPTTSQILLHHGRSCMGHLTSVTQLVTQDRDVYAVCALLRHTLRGRLFLTTERLTGILISHGPGCCMF